MPTLFPKTNARKPTAIVLAAGAPPAALGVIFGKTSSAMVPVNGRPTIHWLLSYLREIGIERVALGMRHQETRLPRFVQQAFGKVHEIICVPVLEDKGPGFTLLECMKKIDACEPCLVVLGDTLFEFSKDGRENFEENFVLTSPVNEAARWCLADVEENCVRQLADKPMSNPGGWPALIGVYFFQDPNPARSALETALAGGCASLQLRHALEPYIAKKNLRAYPAGQWFDCGNVDFLTSSRRRLLQARNFNDIQIDELRGTITKRSEHTSKFLNEINYYRLLPRDLATFFPRLVDFSLNPKDSFLTLEYYGYPTLSEVWVFEEFESEHWKALFQSLRRIISCFEQYSAELAPKAVFDFYWRKTVDRLAAFAAQDAESAALVNAPKINLNGKDLAGWPSIRERVMREVEWLCRTPAGRIIHGDLCFPNILYDPLSRLFKFIDPRGSFGESGIYGDGRYDIAKLLHSLDGGYDFLIHDMFSLERNGLQIEMQQFFPATHAAVLQSFEEVFGERHPMRELRTLEGLLFLSMCPLHKDKPARQAAMFAIGLRILNEILNNENLH